MARRSDHSRAELRELALDAALCIVRERGIEGLSARRVAEAIGYTVGTLYQVFTNMDDLVQQMNSHTLDRLHVFCRNVERSGIVGDDLVTLAQHFVAFAKAHPQEWRAVISYRYAPDHKWSSVYDDKVAALLGLMSEITRDLYREEDADRQTDEMRVLWASLYGMFSLESAGRLGKGQTVARQAETLVSFYLARRGAAA